MELSIIELKIRSCLDKLYNEDEKLFLRNKGQGLCERCLVFTSRTNDPWYKSSEVEFAKGDDLVFRRIRSNGKEDPRTNV